MNPITTEFYVTGGTLRHDAPSYIERQADKHLHDSLKRGEFCYVLTSRQTGKSSLMVHTAARLREEGMAVAVLDLTAIGQNLDVAQWYDGLLRHVGLQLDLEEPLEEFWLENERLAPLQRWMAALQRVILPNCPGRIVFFIDEIDAVKSLRFSTDEFFAAIRECYNRRAREPRFERLTFCLSGVASPSDLIGDPRITPFNIGRRVELTDFTEAEAAPLAEGLGREEKTAAALRQRVLHWTGGHPYLTQRLCRAVAEDAGVGDAAGVDRLCELLFLSAQAQEQDDNLLFVRDRLLRSGADPSGLLDLYDQVRARKQVTLDDTNHLVSVLRLSGIARVEAGRLRVRNRIYERVFDRAWVARHMPDAELRRQRAAFRRGLWRAGTVAATMMAVLAALTTFAWSQRNHARSASRRAEIEAAQSRQLASSLRVVLSEREAAFRAQAETFAKLEAALGRERSARELARLRTGLAQAAEHRERTQRLAAVAARRQFEWEGKRAERERQNAVRAERAAVAEQEQGRQRQVRLSVGTGMRLVEAGDLLGSLPWFAAAQRLDRGHPERQAMHQVRLDTVLQQCPRLVQIWFDAGPIRDAGFSPDGREIITAGDDHTARVWDVRTGQPVTPPLQHTARVLRAAFSPDGRRVLTASFDGTARVWDAVSGRPVTPPLKPDGAVCDAAFSPDGRRIVTASRDGTACLWDASTGRPLTALLRHAGPVNHVAFSPDGHRIVTASSDETARVWDAATGLPVTPPLKHLYPVEYAAFSPDSRRVVTAGDDSTAQVWDAATGAPATPPLRHDNWVVYAQFSPDGRRIVTASSDQTARVWDAATGAPVTPPLKHRGDVHAAAFSPDSRRVITISIDGTARIWDADTGQPVAPPLRHSGGIATASFSPDGRQVVTAGDDGTTRVWDLALGAASSPPLEHRGLVWDAQFSPDGRRVLMITDFGFQTVGEAQVWDVSTNRPITPPLRHADRVSQATFSPDGRRIVTAGIDGTARVWDAGSGRPILAPLRHKGPVYSASFSPDGRRIVTASEDGTAQVWEAATGHRAGRPLRHGLRVNMAAFSLDGRRVVTASDDGTARIWDAGTGAPLIPPVEHDTGVISAVFSPDGRRFVTASWGGTARVWDAATGRPATPPLRHSSIVFYATFSPDGRRVVTASDDQTARVWDAATGRPLTPPLQHGGPVDRALFSPDGTRVVTASWDSTARVWDAATGQPLTPPLQHADRVKRATFSPDGRRVLTASFDGTARIWDLPRVSWTLPEAWLLTQLLAGRPINATDGSGPISPASLRRAWQSLRAKYPQDFAASPAQVLDWHRREARDSEVSQCWAAALPHLNPLIDAEPGNWLLYARRGDAYAELGQWDHASRDYARAAELGADDAWFGGCSLALARLAAGDLAGYRRACSRLLPGVRASQDPLRSYLAAWTCTLAPNAVSDPSRPVQWAKEAVASQPSNEFYLTALGAALYRAGRFDAAIQQLSSLPGTSVSPVSVYNWLFLAMAHARLGHPREARAWLDRAAGRIDQIRRQELPDRISGVYSLRWSLHRVDRPAIQILRREAEALAGSAGP